MRKIVILFFLSAFTFYLFSQPAYQEADGQIVIEAEELWTSTPSNNGRTPEVVNDLAASGGRALYFKEYGQTFNNYSNAPKFNYPINFNSTGVLYIWVRTRIWNTGFTGNHDEFYFALNGSGMINSSNKTIEYAWVKAGFISVSAGNHTLNMGFEDDGQWIDKIILTTDFDFVPEGLGPAADKMLQVDAKKITYFAFKGINYPVEGIIDEATGNILVNAAYGTDVTALVPTINAPYGASVVPASEVPKDFSSPVVYTVTALDNTTKEYVVTVNVNGSASSEKNITSFFLPKLGQFASIDNTAGTLTVDYFTGYSIEQSFEMKISDFATLNSPVISTIVPGVNETFTVTAQDGTTKTYSLVWNVVEGIRGFKDDYVTGDNILWTDGGSNRFIFSWDNVNNELDLQMASTNTYFSSYFNFKKSMNLEGVPLVRLRMKPNTPVNRNGIEILLVDSSNISSGAITFPMDIPDTWYELKFDFSNHLQFSFDAENRISAHKIKQLMMRVDRANGSSTTFFDIDDFRVGTEALANKPPTINRVNKPSYMLMDDPPRQLVVSGITDGNEEREENLMLELLNNNTNAVNAHIVAFDTIAGIVTIEYGPNLQRGISDLTLVVKDDRGMVYSDELDSSFVKILIEVRDPSVNNPPSFTIPDDIVINPVTSQNVIIIPNVTDGDDDKEQNISLTASTTSDLFTVDSVVYKKPHHVALLYISEKGQQGTGYVDISITDDGNVEGNGDNKFTASIPVEVRIQVDQPGVLFEAFEYEFWKEMPYRQNPVVAYSTILPTTHANNTYDNDFFWMRMTGYIIPKITGSYVFSTEDHEGSYLYLSKDFHQSNLPTQDKPTAYKADGLDVQSAPVELVAGNIYYFEAYCKEVVITYNFRVEWVGPGVSSMQPIGTEYIKAGLDIILPSDPNGLELDNVGVRDVTVKWGKSTDNALINGYNIFINGLKVNQEPVIGLEYKAEGLSPKTEYTIAVRAEDQFLNQSAPSNLLTFTTYDEDQIAPEIPEGLTMLDATGLGIQLVWNPSIDNETIIRGYNIYLNGSGIPDNTSLIKDTVYFAVGLEQETEYSFTVTAVDAGYNESGQSLPYMASTIKFNPNDTQDGLKKARVHLTLNPVAEEIGFGVNIGYHASGMTTSNKVKHSYFESPDFPSKLSEIGKASKNATAYATDPVDTYAGKKSARLTVSNGASFKNTANFSVKQGKNYLIKFAMKRDAAYTGAVNIKLWYEFITTLGEASVTPTEEWQEYEVEITAPESFKGAQSTWWVDFIFTGNGTIYLDNVELHLKEFYDGSRFTTIAKEYLNELKVSGLRWGGVEANKYSLTGNVGPYPWENNLTFGDMVALSNSLGGYTYLCSGTGAGTDFWKNPQTHADMIEYFAGPTSSKWGALRVAEGYDSLLSSANKIIIEFGNEVWGNGHGAAEEIGGVSKTINYAKWANQMAAIIKASPYYNPDKFLTSYAGGSPDDWRYNMVDIPILKEDNKTVDLLSQSGYLSAGFVAAPDIPFGESALDYHKNTLVVMQNKLKGAEDHLLQMLNHAGRILPMYYYEGNNSPNLYHGKLGNAIHFTDFYANLRNLGSIAQVIFTLDGGVWKLVDIENNYRKMPQFHTTKLFNSYCKGTMLESHVETENTIESSNGQVLTLKPIGAYSYTNGTSYSVALFSRDFENDYFVQIDLPDELAGLSASGKLITLTGERYDANEVIVSEESIVFGDSLLITLPKYSMVILNFEANDQNFTNVPLVDSTYKKVEEIILEPYNGVYEITQNGGSIPFTVKVLPEDALLKTLKFDLISTDSTFNGVYRVLSNTLIANSGIGTVIVRASAKDNSGLYDEVEISVNIKTVGVDFAKFKNGMKIYPNPADDQIHIILPDVSDAVVKLFDTHGKLVKQFKSFGNNIQLDVNELPKGVYYLEVQQGIVLREKIMVY